jgi:hypothetical protein
MTHDRFHEHELPKDTETPMRAFGFALDTGTATYLTQAETREKAEAELRRQFGDHLILVEDIP